MPRLTNTTRQTIAVVTGVKDGVAQTEDILSGETKDVAADMESGAMRGHLMAGSLKEEGGSPARRSKKPEGE